MYIDAVTRGIDDLPTISDEIRTYALNLYREYGIERLHEELRRLDPEYLSMVDIHNHKRLIHAIEITLQAGRPYSSMRTGEVKQRDFKIVKIALDYPREQLFNRINRRVETMIEAGLEDEARSVYHLRHLNSLNTVGYKEMFAYFDGTMNRDTAIARIQKNTRVYAKKQLTWLKRLNDTIMLPPDTTATRIMDLIKP